MNDYNTDRVSFGTFPRPASIWLDARVSVYPNVFSSRKGLEEPLGAVLKYLVTPRDPSHQRAVEAVHLALQSKPIGVMAKDHRPYRAAKKQLLCPTFSGTVTRLGKGNTQLHQHSGALALDFDALAYDEAVRLVDAAMAIPSTLATFLSPSHEGIKVVVALKDVPRTKDDHLQAYMAAVSVYPLLLGYEVDQAGKDLDRLCLLGSDPGYRCRDPEEPVHPLDWKRYIPRESAPNQPRLLSKEPEKASKFTRAPRPDHEIDVEALYFLEPPQDYNVWLSWLVTLKAAGFTVDEVEIWSATGVKYNPREVHRRWNGLPHDDPDSARRRLRGSAYTEGWRQGVHNAQSGAIGQHGTLFEGDGDSTTGADANQWPPIFPIKPSLPPQPPYPDWPPGVLRDTLEAAVRVASSSRPTAAAILLGAASLLASHEYVVQTLSPLPCPASLYTVPVIESGWRKSTVFELLLRGHAAADKAAVSRHSRAKAESAAHQGTKGMADVGLSRKTKRFPPRALRGDDTLEVVRQRLDAGRPTALQALDEAGSLLHNWSFGPGQIARTLATYSTLWSGGMNSEARINDNREIFLAAGSYAFCLCWMGQFRKVLRILMSEDAEDGFTARVLLSVDDSRPVLQEPLLDDQKTLAIFNEAVQAWREEQDIDMEYEDEENTLDKRLITLEPGARRLLQDFNSEQETISDRMFRSRRYLEQSSAGRAAEQAARIAAVWTAWDCRNANAAPVITVDTASAAIQVVQWHGNELARVVGSGGIGALTQSAQDAIDLLSAAVQDPQRFREGRSPLIDQNGLVAVSSLLNRYGRGDLRKNTKLRRDVIVTLEREHYIRRASRGRYHINPHLDSLETGEYD